MTPPLVVSSATDRPGMEFPVLVDGIDGHRRHGVVDGGQGRIAGDVEDTTLRGDAVGPVGENIGSEVVGIEDVASGRDLERHRAERRGDDPTARRLFRHREAGDRIPFGRRY